MITLGQINMIDANEFTSLLGDIFEDSPWIAGKSAHAFDT
jgi:2-oxo-4-hydroxy-4-carboxy--5-ureidoimidazoline (OHCU) decarboxylase